MHLKASLEIVMWLSCRGTLEVNDVDLVGESSSVTNEFCS